jgi:hypothetical protein
VILFTRGQLKVAQPGAAAVLSITLRASANRRVATVLRRNDVVELRDKLTDWLETVGVER